MVPTPTQLPRIVVVPPPSGPAKQLIRYNTLNPFTSQPYWLETLVLSTLTHPQSPDSTSPQASTCVYIIPKIKNNLYFLFIFPRHTSKVCSTISRDCIP